MKNLNENGPSSGYCLFVGIETGLLGVGLGSIVKLGIDIFRFKSIASGVENSVAAPLGLFALTIATAILKGTSWVKPDWVYKKNPSEKKK